MENSEKGKFEQEWGEAFRHAEGSVSESVWNNIDLELTHAESGVMRKRVVFYQRLAAAAVLFAFLVGGGSLYFNGVKASREESQLAVEGRNQTNEPTNSEKSSIQSEKITEAQTANSKNENDVWTNSKFDETNEQRNTFTSQGKESIILLTPSDEDPSTQQTNASPLLELARRRIEHHRFSMNNIFEAEVAIAGAPKEVTLWRKLPAMPAEYMDNSKKDKNKNNESLWASLGASAGNYSPNISSSGAASSSTSQSFASALSSSGSSKSSDRGSAYAFGMAVGTKISDRWVVQGGMNYLSQTLGYQSSLASLNSGNQLKALVSDYRVAESSNVQVTSPYEVNSINEIVSLPFQAGYLFIDRKFGLQLNTGIATDIFIRNTLVDQSGQLSKYSESAGADSPYRTMSWAGLVGTELSYKIANHYRISLVPGLRYSFNSVLKEQSGSVSNPLMMDVGFRFRYIFK